MELLNTALELGLTECAECGEQFEVDIPSGRLEKLKRLFLSPRYYRVNIAVIDHVTPEEPKAYCSPECSREGL